MLVLFVASILSVVGTFVAFFSWKNPSISDFFTPLFGRSAQLILGIKNIFKNPKLLNQSRPCIFISNHQSNIDAWTITANIPKRTVTLGKIELVFIPFFGWLYYLLGHILINRKNKMSSRETLQNLSQELIRRNISIWILPEGTRSKGRGLLPFKKGPFHLAINSKLPIIPIAISTYHKNLNLNKWRSGTVLFKAYPMVETKDLNPEDVDALAQKCQEIIRAGNEELDNELKLSGE